MAQHHDGGGRSDDMHCTPQPLPLDRYQRRPEVEQEIVELHGRTDAKIVEALRQNTSQVNLETLVYFVRWFVRRGRKDYANSVLQQLHTSVAGRVERYFAGIHVAKNEDRVDLVHDVLLDMYLAVLSTEPRHAFWEVQFNYALKRRILEHRRAYWNNQHHEVQPLPDNESEMPGDVSAPNQLGQSFVGSFIELANRLPEELRKAVRLYYVLGYQEKEIAEMLGCTERTVRNRLKRGTALLRQMAEDEGLSP